MSPRPVDVAAVEAAADVADRRRRRRLDSRRAVKGATVEGWSGMPTLDQRAALDFAIEDARKAVAELNRIVTTDIPAAYKTAKKEWARKVKPVGSPQR